jgi:hypothetical protein
LHFAPWNGAFFLCKTPQKSELKGGDRLCTICLADMIDFLPFRGVSYCLVLCFFQLFTGLAHAQTIAVSSTAAWSSQIVAFWGAILIAVRASPRNQVTNSIAAIYSSAHIVVRARQVYTALSRGNWFLHSGWNNGHIRTEVALVHWRTPEELRQLSRRVALEIEVFGDRWEVLVLGHQIRGQGSEGSVHWIKSPRSAGVAVSKFKADGQNAFPLSHSDIADGITMLQSQGKSHLGGIVQDLGQKAELKGTRVALLNEMPHLENSDTGASWAKIFTSIDHQESPFLGLSRWTGQYGTDRGCNMNCASRMYFVVLITVSCAIGLMGAASGRGLAVWVMAVKPTLATLGAQNVQGNSVIGSLLALDKSGFRYETADGSRLLAGDITSPAMTSWQLTPAFLMPLAELLLISAGWLYGALKVTKLRPAGVVGHGMLWLSTMVSLALSLRALFSIRQRLSGRLVGFWRNPYFDRTTVGAKSTEISVDRIMTSSTYSNTVLGFVGALLRDSPHDDTFVVECTLRLPDMGNLLAQHVVTDILKYRYTDDNIVSQGDPPTSVRTTDVYPWIQTCCCIVLTIICCCVSIVYAYFSLPFWVKPLTEGVTAANATWFSTLERTSGLKHNRDTYVCFMIATLVVSSVWYVGVKDVG